MVWRYRFVIACLFLTALALVWRLTHLHINQRDFLLQQSEARILRTISTPAYRGMIKDRHGEPLAVSTAVDSAWVDPQSFNPSDNQWQQIAVILDLPVKSLKNRVKKNSHREFTYLKRHLIPEISADLKKLKLPGLYFQREYHRYYPEGNAMAHILGMTNLDDRGQEGIELAYDGWLRGKPGKKQVLKDRRGRIISEVAVMKPSEPGHDIVLSIDKRLQFVAYRHLAWAITQYKAKSGSIVMLDPKTGEVMAMVNAPSFNPNDRREQTHTHNYLTGSYRNRAVTDVFEPGSTLKPFSMTSVLRHGEISQTKKIPTSPGWMMVRGKTVKDIHDYGALTPTEILQKSSNVGMTKLILTQPGESLWNTLRDLGFGESTGSGFPGESAGSLMSRHLWPDFTLATLSFGYGMSSTALQLAQAYSVIAAGGMKYPVSFLKLDAPMKGEQVLAEPVANEIRSMLEAVVKPKATAHRAQIPGYRVAGKTGTVRVVGKHGYEEHRHIALFAGLVPVSNPRLVMVVVLNEPSGKQYYGGKVAAPVFAKVAAEALRILAVPPDGHILS